MWKLNMFTSFSISEPLNLLVLMADRLNLT